MIITISGNAGAGKTTVAKIISKKLGAEFISVGNMRRKLALSKKMTLGEFNKYAETHPEADVDVDKLVSEKARKLAGRGNVVVEGRMQYHFLQESLKIFLKVDLDVGAGRIWDDLQESNKRNEGEFGSLEELKGSILQRQKSDMARYKKYYNLNPYDEPQYDLVIDTSDIRAEEVAEKIVGFINKNI